MKRRTFLASGLALMIAGTALAQSLQDRLVGQLRAQGFSDIRVSTTLLRRTRIVAVAKDQRREIIFNPNTGEILRDYWQLLSTPGPDGQLVTSGGSGSSGNSGHGSNNSGSGGGNSGPGGGHDDDDDDDHHDGEDEEDEDEKDNSGPGGGDD